MTDVATGPALPAMREPEVLAPHVLVVFEDEMGVHEFTLECPGVDDRCRAWSECTEDRCPVGDDCVQTCADPCAIHGSELDEAEAHGIRHRYLGTAHIGWGVPHDTCWPATSGELVEAAYNIRTDWIRGRYPVHCGLDDNDEHLTLTLIEEN